MLKRACACFGLGRYLYDLDTVWVDLDQYNGPVRTPILKKYAGSLEPEALDSATLNICSNSRANHSCPST